MSTTRTDASNRSLSDLVTEVEGSGQTLKLYNETVSEPVIERIEAHFEVTTVTVERVRDDSHAENHAVLAEAGKVLATADIEQLSAAVDPAGPLSNPDTVAANYPALLTEVDQTTFTEYGKRRMILASRDVEKRAWRTESPALHVGFQEFSRLRTQTDLYSRLTQKLTVHLYGVPDWEPPFENVEYHGYDTNELRSHWFVVFEPGEWESEPGSRAILAEEREENVYSGFWTSRRGTADEILRHLGETYPANNPFA